MTKLHFETTSGSVYLEWTAACFDALSSEDSTIHAGKSSLLAALLGEMYKEGGTVSVAGSVAFAAQDPWIQNATLKDNVLMGNTYNEDR